MLKLMDKKILTFLRSKFLFISAYDNAMYISDNFKPTVAHRDFNSRNILVKPDLCCVIADLGFCISTMGSKLIHKSHTENAEQTSLTDVSIYIMERSSTVVECLTRDRGAPGSSLTGVTTLCP